MSIAEVNLETAVKKEDLIITLERTIGFVRNCDNKASIFLGVFGLILSSILTTDGVSNIYNVVKSMIETLTFCSILHFILIILSVISIIIGLIYIGRVLCVQVDFNSEAELDCDSKIFFEHITNNGSFLSYKEKLFNLTENELLNDIASQIYINSCISSDKYRLYRIGIKFCMMGALFFISLWIMGIIIY